MLRVKHANKYHNISPPLLLSTRNKSDGNKNMVFMAFFSKSRYELYDLSTAVESIDHGFIGSIVLYIRNILESFRKSHKSGQLRPHMMSQQQ